MKQDAPDCVVTLIRLAQKFQLESGGFLPFGYILDGGERKYQAADSEDAKEIISVLDTIFRDRAAQGSLEWASLCTDIRVFDREAYPDGIDAIQVAYEDRVGQSVNYFVPYQEGADGALDYQPLFARVKERRWFS